MKDHVVNVFLMLCCVGGFAGNLMGDTQFTYNKQEK